MLFLAKSVFHLVPLRSPDDTKKEFNVCPNSKTCDWKMCTRWTQMADAGANSEENLEKDYAILGA